MALGADQASVAAYYKLDAKVLTIHMLDMHYLPPTEIEKKDRLYNDSEVGPIMASNAAIDNLVEAETSQSTLKAQNVFYGELMKQSALDGNTPETLKLGDQIRKNIETLNKLSSEEDQSKTRIAKLEGDLQMIMGTAMTVFCPKCRAELMDVLDMPPEPIVTEISKSDQK